MSCSADLKSNCFWSAAGILLLISAVPVTGQQNTWFERQSEWHGYAQFHFKIANRNAYLVAPHRVASGSPWIWRARFPDYHSEMDVALLARGYHIAYVDVAGLFGSPRAVDIGDEFYQYLTGRRGLALRPVLEGVSRGGLFVYNWAARNPEKVACIYCDTPVLDFKSWPAGRGKGLGSERDWKACQEAYKLTEPEAISFADNPIDHAATISRAKIPILHIVSENDRVVPPDENTYLLRARLKKHDHALEVMSVAMGTAASSGHHFDHPNANRVVQFIVEHSEGKEHDRRANSQSHRMALLEGAKRIVFLGDSITYAGHYVARFEAWLLKQGLADSTTIINVGLPSETVSGLSEAGHAGGRFPRPDLGERLERVLAKTKPDLVLACYGINCGIYQAFDDQRFEKYKAGIRNLKQHVNAVGAQLILVTPPVFDDLRAKKSFLYDPVLDQYSDWLLAQQQQGWSVIDLHGPMKRELSVRRETDAEFTFQPDAVHPNAAGHEFIANQLVAWFGGDPTEFADGELVKVATERMQLLRDAYLYASGHKRPGIKPGLPIAWAKDRSKKLDDQIRDLLE